jgi:hypothetical protein
MSGLTTSSCLLDIALVVDALVHLGAGLVPQHALRDLLLPGVRRSYRSGAA